VERRNFIAALGIGTLATSALPLVGATSCKPEDQKNKNEHLCSSTSPYKECYSGNNRVRSGIALGGIGAGSIELRKDGKFYNWTIFNNQPLGIGNPFQLMTAPRDGWEDSLLFFIVRYQVEGELPKMKLLNISNSLGEAGLESTDYYYPWLSAVKEIEYQARFPFVNMKFTDPEMPFTIEMEAYSPFIPHDVKNSALPAVYFNFKLKATGDKPVNVMLIGSQRNTVSYDVYEKYFTSKVVKNDNAIGFEQSVGGVDETSMSFGQMGLISLSQESTYHVGWEHKHPYYEKLLVTNHFENIEDTDGRNHFDKKLNKKLGNSGYRNKDQRMFSSVAITRDLSPKGKFEHTFAMVWNFPNNYGSHNSDAAFDYKKDFDIGQKTTKLQGHFYSNFFNNLSEIAQYVASEKEQLLEKTRKFVSDFYASDIDLFVLDQVNSQLNTFITSSTLTQTGTFAIREGLTPDKAWGPNATTDVSLYGSIPVLCLFPELQKSTIKAHALVQTTKGEVAHGLGFDLDYTQNGTWGVYDRIDLPGQFIIMALRDFFWTNDLEYLKTIWPNVKKAINYVLDYRDRNGDQMPEMEGIMCSYDNFPMYGLASYIQSQWLTAMKSAAEAARVIGDTETGQKCSAIFNKGSELMDKHLWNGKYYRLYNDYTGEKGVDEGCLTDQIIGQWAAHFSGLGYLFKEEHVKSALKNILEMSYNHDFGLRNCSWKPFPGLFPIESSDLWVDQANTCWTGVELAFASFLIYEGFLDEGLEVVRTVDNRYRKAGLYWDHQEFGGHYYRPMSAWAIVNSILGLSINQLHYTFSPKLLNDKFKLFFAFNCGTAHFIRNGQNIEIHVLSGKMECKKITLKGTALNHDSKISLSGKTIEATISIEDGIFIAAFSSPIIINENDFLKIG
jgi:uncharacterized protein (DUF608 family)